MLQKKKNDRRFHRCNIKSNYAKKKETEKKRGQKERARKVIKQFTKQQEPNPCFVDRGRDLDNFAANIVTFSFLDFKGCTSATLPIEC